MNNYLPDQNSTDIFSEDIKPAKPWYKHWWLYVYLIIFFVSLFILVIYAENTSKVFNAFSVDQVSKSLANVVVGGGNGFTQAPNLETTTEIDYAAARERLKFVDGPSIGDINAPITIVEFADFQCPFCQEVFPVLKQVLADYSQEVRFIYLDFPLDSLHPLAFQAALAARCAAEQGAFWQYHDSLFANQDILDEKIFSVLAQTNNLDINQFNTCLDSDKYTAAIIEQFSLGRELGVTGTPTFFVNGHKLPGVIPFTAWEQIINLILYSGTTE